MPALLASASIAVAIAPGMPNERNGVELSAAQFVFRSLTIVPASSQLPSPCRHLAHFATAFCSTMPCHTSMPSDRGVVDFSFSDSASSLIAARLGINRITLDRSLGFGAHSSPHLRFLCDCAFSLWAIPTDNIFSPFIAGVLFIRARFALLERLHGMAADRRFGARFPLPAALALSSYA